MKRLVLAAYSGTTQNVIDQIKLTVSTGRSLGNCCWRQVARYLRLHEVKGRVLFYDTVQDGDYPVHVILVDQANRILVDGYQSAGGCVSHDCAVYTIRTRNGQPEDLYLIRAVTVESESETEMVIDRTCVIKAG